MIIKRKTQIILALFVSSVFLFQNCASIISRTSERRFQKSKQGSIIIITKKDGYQTAGELITVKPNSLLLLDTEGKDVSVSIEEIKVIRIVKKSKVWKGAGSGLLLGGIGGILLIPAFKALAGEDFILDSLIENIEEATHSWTVAFALIGGTVGLLIGGIAGAVAGADKTIQIEGMADLEIREALEKLRKKARIRDYK